LTQQLLAFGHGQVLEFKNVNLNTVLEGMENLVERVVGEGVEIERVRDARLGMVKADSGQMKQVIMNLAANARDAVPDGGKLRIETANVYLEKDETAARRTLQAGHYVVIAITDTGSGVSEETLSRAFEPFFTTRNRGTATGLGLER
jgi:signal transduction histidine kinase